MPNPVLVSERCIGFLWEDIEVTPLNGKHPHWDNSN